MFIFLFGLSLIGFMCLRLMLQIHKLFALNILGTIAGQRQNDDADDATSRTTQCCDAIFYLQMKKTTTKFWTKRWKKKKTNSHSTQHSQFSSVELRLLLRPLMLLLFVHHGIFTFVLQMHLLHWNRINATILNYMFESEWPRRSDIHIGIPISHARTHLMP